MTRYAIGLGSNLGDRRQILGKAVTDLGGLGAVVAVSGLYETDPVGGPEQGRYLNAVVLVDSDLDVLELLAGCQRIEAAAGRVREVRWGPRTLDVDIITSDGPAMSTASLEVPHPRARLREFVLRPLVDVWPEAPIGEGVNALDALGLIQDQHVARVDAEWVR
ncbi:MAG: 2-amino-4-hydroxy-6-hydroxymethyldihydropteridine diphosphokinase [Acidimicrobiia bacterium]